MKMRFIAAMLLATMLLGCTTIYQNKYAFDAGWREAKIINTGAPADAQLELTIDCRKKGFQTIGGQYITARYMFLGKLRWYGVFPIPQSGSFKPGEMVYVNINDCKYSAIKQTVR